MVLHCYIDIPPGDSKLHAEFPSFLDKGPEMHFYQKEGKRSCLLLAFANLLWYSKCRLHANLIFTQQKHWQKFDTRKIFYGALMEMSANLKSKEIVVNISLLQNKLRHFPVITCVKGSDGKEDHSIAIYSGWFLMPTLLMHYLYVKNH